MDYSNRFSANLIKNYGGDITDNGNIENGGKMNEFEMEKENLKCQHSVIQIVKSL